MVPAMPETPGEAPSADLADLRARIDRLDQALIDVVAERLAVCQEVADRKHESGASVIQPSRVRDVVTSRRQQAIEAGVDPDFVEQLFRVLLTETHRIEVAGLRHDQAPDKVATSPHAGSGLDTVASRVDHLVVAVESAVLASATLTERYGFHAHPDPQHPEVITMVAGGVTVVLVGRAASAGVGDYLDRNGPGVQHVAVEVLNAGFTRSCLEDLGATLVTPVLVDADGHEQFFAADEADVGVRLGFLSRTGHRVGIGAHNVLAMFDAASAR